LFPGPRHLSLFLRPFSHGKKASMKKISHTVAATKAIEMVMNAYNTELIASWLRPLGGESERQGGCSDAVTISRSDCAGDGSL